MTGVKRILWTLGMVALWGFLGAMSSFQWNFWGMDTTEWKSVATAVVAGVGMFLSNYLNPYITQYGIGSE